MIIKIDKTFDKDARKIKDKALLIKIADIIEQFKNIDDPGEIRNIKKLRGASDFYRIRVGEYRIGIKIKFGNVYFIRLLHRKEIYKYFP